MKHERRSQSTRLNSSSVTRLAWTLARAGSAHESIRRYTIAGVAVVVFLTLGVGGWATTTEIAGALIAPGTVVVESNIKKVQHPTGGVVGELRVKDGDRVKAGDLLVRLDDTVTRANLAIVTKTLTELTARKARLSAERDGSDRIKFPDELMQRGRCAGRRAGHGGRDEAFRFAPLGARRAEIATARAHQSGERRDCRLRRAKGREGQGNRLSSSTSSPACAISIRKISSRSRG